MKKRLLTFGIISMVMLSMAGCGSKKVTVTTENVTEDYVIGTDEDTETREAETVKENTTEAKIIEDNLVDFFKEYSPILEKYKRIIVTGEDEVIGDDEEYGVYETVMYRDKKELLANIGFLIEDISGDDIPELIIGEAGYADIENSKGAIYAIYTFQNGEIKFVCRGWGRNWVQLLDDNRIITTGSSGAAYSHFGLYHLSIDGVELQAEDFYFTAETDETFENFAVYHNNTALYEKEQAEVVDMPVEDFYSLTDEYENKIRDIKFTPFADFNSTGESVSQDDNVSNSYESKGMVIACWEADVKSSLSDYSEFVANDSEYSTKVVLSAEDKVKDFRFLNLEYKDVNENGSIVFDIKELYYQEYLTVDRPLVVTLSMPGDIPNNGFSFVCEDGTTRYFSINQSGMDGSLVIQEFFVD